MKQVLITTAHRGVFAGEIADDQDLSAKSMPVQNARMFIYWATTRGVMELAHVGPNSRSKVSLPADISMLHDITAIFEMTEDAWKKTQEF